jgi:hypothetical protein
MNATPAQPHPAEWEETAGLLPRVERDLPAGRHQVHKELLMSRIHDDLRTTQPAPAAPARQSNPFLRRVVILPVAAFALAGALATGVYVFGGASSAGTGDTIPTGPVLTTTVGAADPKGATQLLDRISLAAAKTPTTQVSKVQYIYIESISAGAYESTDFEKNKTTVVTQKLHKRQTWMSPDGMKGWLIEPGTTGAEGETLDADNGWKPNLNAPSYNYLKALPTDPDTLLKKIYKETKGRGNGPDQEAFTSIGDLLSQSYPPTDLSVALYKAAAKIPGVVKVDDAVDAAGRHGVAIARLDETSGQRTEWIFDKKTFAWLGQRTVQVKHVSDGSVIKPGTITHTNAIMTRAIVDGIKKTPSRAS